MKKILCLLGVSCALTTGSAFAKETSTVFIPRVEVTGQASVYGPGLWGHKTASGKIMKHGDMTVAHRYYPMGTMLIVKNNENGKSVVVTVNDRGPYIKHRIIDIAEKPASFIGLTKNSIGNVSVYKVEAPTEVEVAAYVGEKPIGYTQPVQ